MGNHKITYRVVVIDHNSLIPYGDKSDNEKRSILEIGDKLLDQEFIWILSCRYLKTCITKCRTIWYRMFDSLPWIQRFLYKNGYMLIRQCKRSKNLWCKKRRLHSRGRLLFHILGREAFKLLSKRNLDILVEYVDSKFEFEDKEIVSLALLAAYQYNVNVDLISLDDKLINNLRELLDLVARKYGSSFHIDVYKPSEFTTKYFK